MAIVKNLNDEESVFGGATDASQQTSNPTQAGGGGTMAGASGGAQPQQKSAAPRSSWYNIQNFLGANQPEADLSRQSIGSSAQGIISEQANNSKKAQDEIKAKPIEQAKGFDQNQIQNYSEQDVQQGLGQNYKPLDYSGYSLAAPQQLQNLGATSGAKDIYGTFAQQKPKSVGAKNMEAALLGSGAEGAKFVNEFVPKFKTDYESQVTNPYKQTIEKRQAEEAKAAEEIAAAQGQWNSGLTGWTQSQQQAIEQKLNEMKGQKAQTLADVQDYTSESYNPYGTGDLGNQSFMQWLADAKAKNPAYNTPSYYMPEATRANAAYDVLGGMEGANKYNKIAQLLGNTPMETVAEQQGKAGWQGLDEAKQAYEAQSRRTGLNSANQLFEKENTAYNENKMGYDKLQQQIDDLQAQRQSHIQRNAETVGLADIDNPTPYDEQINQLAKDQAAYESRMKKHKKALDRVSGTINKLNPGKKGK